MASVVTEPRTTPFFRGHIAPSRKTSSLLPKKSRTSELVLEKIFDTIITTGSMKISCFLAPKKKKEQFFNTHQEFTFIDTQKNQEVTAYFKIPPVSHTDAPTIDADKILANLTNQNKVIIAGTPYETPAPPAQRFCTSKLNTKCTDIEGIPVKELDKIYKALTIIGLANPSPHKMQEYTLTFGQRTFTAYVDTTPNGLDPFICFNPIGSGMSKHVYRGLNLRTKKIRAYSLADISIGIKRTPNFQAILDTANYEVALREQETIQTLSKNISPQNPCPNLVRYFGITNVKVNQAVQKIDRTGKKIMTVEQRMTQIAEMQFAELGDFFHLIQEVGKRFSPKEIVDIIGQLFNGIAFLHKNGMIHKDLKLENVFLHINKNGDPHVKIGDFGFISLNGTCGSPAYTAPEIFNETSHSKLIERDPKNLYTTACDVYSLSVITFALITRFFPDFSYSIQELANNKKLSDRARENTTRKHLENYLKSPPSFDFGYNSVPEKLNTLYLKMSAASPLKRDNIQALTEFHLKHKKELEEEITQVQIELRELGRLEKTFLQMRMQLKELTTKHFISHDNEMEAEIIQARMDLKRYKKNDASSYKKVIENEINRMQTEIERITNNALLTPDTHSLI